MPMIFRLQLGDITLKELQEDDEDEIYIVGGVRVYKSDGTAVAQKSKFFTSSNITVFKPAHVGVVRPLNPQGEVYNMQLEDDEIAVCKIFVVEHDAASTVKNVTEKLRAFLDDANLSSLENVPMLEAGAKLAEILLDFVNTLSNIFDGDDIIGEWQKTYRMKSIWDRKLKPRNRTIWHHPISFSANMDDALYDPVTADAYFIKV